MEYKFNSASTIKSWLAKGSFRHGFGALILCDNGVGLSCPITVCWGSVGVLYIGFNRDLKSKIFYGLEVNFPRG